MGLPPGRREGESDRERDRLIASEGRLAAIFAQASVGLSEMSLDGRFLQVNDELCRILGRPREELLGLGIAEVTYEDDVPPSLDAVARALRDGGTATLDKRYQRPDGSLVWASSSVTLLREDGDGPGSLLVVTVDLTARRRAEEALRESEERFRSFAENSADVLWIVDAASMRLEYLSPAFETVWGEARDGVSADLRRWAELVHPEDRERASQGLPRLVAGESYSQEYRILRPCDGTVRWIRDTGFPIRDEGGPVRRFAGIAQDVTESKEAEQSIRRSRRRLRSLIEGIPQLVWRAEEAGRWTWSSPQWSAYTGRREEESLGFGWVESIHPDDREPALAAWLEATARGGYDVEYRILGAEGAYRWFRTRAAPVRDEATGEVVEWLGTSTDIDELRSLQDRQRLLLAELQHRVRNTLGVVRSIARRTARTSDTVEDYAMHLEGRIDAFAQVQAAVTRDPMGGVDLEILVADALLAVGAHEGGQVSGIGGPRVRLRAKAAGTMALAVHELATNAVKYGALSAERGRIAVGWTVEAADDGGRLVLRWTETGVALSGEAPKRRGFGTELLERTIPYELGGEASLRFEPTGASCTIVIPTKGAILP